MLLNSFILRNLCFVPNVFYIKYRIKNVQTPGPASPGVKIKSELFPVGEPQIEVVMDF